MLRPLFNDFEQLTSEDLNSITILEDAVLSDVLNNSITGAASILAGLSVNFITGDQLQLATGRAISASGIYLANDNGAFDLLATNPQYDNTNGAPAAVPNSTWFLVEIQAMEIDGASESRNFIDQDGNTFSQSVVKSKTRAVTARIKIGTGSAAPTVDSGWTKIAEVHKGTGTYTIYNVDSYFTTAVATYYNTGWTTEKQVTTKIKNLSSHRSAATIDHPLGSITELHLDSSLQTKVNTVSRARVTVTSGVTVLADSTDYIANSASVLEFQLPATAGEGWNCRITAKGTGGYKITQGASQYIFWVDNFGNVYSTVVGTTGEFNGTLSKNSIYLACTTANTEFMIEDTPTGKIAFAFDLYGFIWSQNITNANRFTFATEAISTTTIALPSPNTVFASAYSKTAGYVLGGNNGGGSRQIVEKMVFLVELLSSLGNILPTGVEGAAGAQSLTDGFVFGGDSGAVQNIIQGISFSSDVTSTKTKTLVSGRTFYGGAGSASLHAYTFGGFIPGGGGTWIDTIHKYAFDDSSISVLAATLAAQQYACAVVSGPLWCAKMGGNIAGPGYLSSIQRVTFSTDAVDTLGTTLGTANSEIASVESSAKGYALGGTQGAGNFIDRLDFTTATNTTLAAVLSAAAGNLGGGLSYRS